MPIERELMSVSPAQSESPACMRPPALVDQLDDAPILEDEVVRGDLGSGIAEPIQRRVGGRHAGIVEEQISIGLPAARSPWLGEARNS